MFISSNNLLNILLPNDNKVLKEALKEADSQTLEQMSKKSGASVNDVLKDLFENLKNGNKSNTSIETLLKNSSMFKDLGSVSTNLTTLLKDVSQDESLQKFKPLIENFLKNIKDMDSATLKEQIKNSGVFLESKLSQTTNSKLESVLNQLQNIVKNIDSPQAKEVLQLLNKLLQTPQNQSNSANTEFSNNLKSLTKALQDLNTSLNPNQTQNLSNLNKQLKSLINTGALIESKIENNASLDKTILLNNQVNTKANSQVNTQSNNQINNQIASTQTNIQANIQTNNQASLLNLQSKENTNTNTLLQNNTQVKDLINNQTKDLLLQIKSDILQNPTLVNKNILPMIDSLLKMPDLFIKGENLANLASQNNLSTFSNNFMSNLNPLLTNLKENLEVLNPNNSNLQNHLTKLVNQVENIIQDLINNPKNESKINEDMKSVLLQMQDELASKTDPKSQDLAKQIDKLLAQIDYHQLVSLSSNTNSVYLPFFWEMLEDGSISMKKTDEEKFYCQINLTLKDFGKVDLMLALYDKNKLDLTIYAQREHFKTALRENMQKLKIALNSVDLIPINIKLLDLKEEKNIIEEPTSIYTNNGYDQNNDSSSKINIRV